VKPTLSETLSVMKEVDKILEAGRADKTQADWVKVIKDEYTKQGLDVSEDTIEKAILDRATAKYVFVEPKGFWKVLAQTAPYQKSAIVSLAALSLASVLTVSAVNFSEARTARLLASTNAQVEEINTWTSTVVKEWPASKMTSPTTSFLHSSWSRGVQRLSEKSSKSFDNLDAAKKNLTALSQQKASLLAQLSIVQNSIAFEEWYKKTPKPVNAWSSDGAQQAMQKRSLASSDQIFASVASNENLVRQLYAGDAQYSESVKALSLWPAQENEKKEALLNQEIAAWQVSAAAGAKAHDLVLATDRFFKTKVTFKIASESGEKTGVWRTMKNTNIKNYYIVVHPVTSTGQVVAIPVLNEENGQTVVKDVLAFRVSADTYEKVKNDKVDDGIVDNNIMAEKAAMSFQLNFKIPSTGGSITEW